MKLCFLSESFGGALSQETVFLSISEFWDFVKHGMENRTEKQEKASQGFSGCTFRDMFRDDLRCPWGGSGRREIIVADAITRCFLR